MVGFDSASSTHTRASEKKQLLLWLLLLLLLWLWLLLLLLLLAAFQPATSQASCFATESMRSRQNVAALYQQANALKLSLQNDLRALEEQKSGSVGEGGPAVVEVADVRKRVDEFEQCLGTMGQLASTSSKKVLWTSRHQQLAKELWGFNRALNQHAQHQQASQYQRDHDALMGGGLASVVIQDYQEEADSLKRSDSHLEQYLEQGQNVLTDLRLQRTKLRGVGQKMRDMLGSIGVSRSLLRLAERQNTIDRYTVYGGMALVLLIAYVTYFFDTSVSRFNLI